jgi:hypothetical protein
MATFIFPLTKYTLYRIVNFYQKFQSCFLNNSSLCHILYSVGHHSYTYFGSLNLFKIVDVARCDPSPAQCGCHGGSGALLGYAAPAKGLCVPHEACLTEEDSFCFQSLFEGLGHNGDSLMGIMKLSEGLRNWSSSIEMSSEKEILKAGDANSNSALDFEEFLQHLWDHEKKHGW